MGGSRWLETGARTRRRCDCWRHKIRVRITFGTGGMMRGPGVRRPFGVGFGGFAAAGFAGGLAFLVGVGAAALPAGAAPSHGLSLFGDLKYGPDFTQFDY